jgi:hypothetical protein
MIIVTISLSSSAIPGKSLLEYDRVAIQEAPPGNGCSNRRMLIQIERRLV